MIDTLTAPPKLSKIPAGCWRNLWKRRDGIPMPRTPLPHWAIKDGERAYFARPHLSRDIAETKAQARLARGGHSYAWLYLGAKFFPA